MLAGMVVKPKSAAFYERNIGKAVVFFLGNQTLLQILGMGQGPRVDNACFFEEGGANQAVEVGTGY